MDGARPPGLGPLLAIVFLLNGTEFLQSGMIAFGASAIMGQVNASPDEFIIAVVAYAAVAITAISVQHWLVERVGWRAYVQWSAAVFVVGGIICSTSAGFGQFLLGRCVMALGGAGFMTAARLLINLIPPSPARMKGIGAFGSSLALGNALAPWVAASAVDADHWEGMFAVPAALAVLAAMLAVRTLPNQLVPELDRTRAHPVLLLAILCASLLTLYALQWAAFDYYADPLRLLACLAAGLLAGALVIRHQLRQKRPLLELRKLLQPRYLAGLALFAFCYVILGANNTILPALLQRALGAPLVAIGGVQTAGLLSSVVAFVAMLAVLRKYPAPRKFYVVGFAFLAWFAWQLSRLNTDADLLRDVLPAIACFGVFLILVLATTAIHTFTGLQTDEVGFNHGQMIKNMMSQVGIALGIAGATLGLQWRIAEHSTVLARRFANGDTAFTALRDQLAFQGGAQMATAQLGQIVNQQAALLASVDYFSLLMVVAIVSAVVMVLQRVFR